MGVGLARGVKVMRVPLEPAWERQLPPKPEIRNPILLQNPSCYIGPGALDYRFGRGVKVGKFWLP